MSGAADTTPWARPGGHLLVTGGAGFIGSCFVRQVLARKDGTRVTVLDQLTYAGNRANLAAVEADPEQAARLRFVVGDIADPLVVGPLVGEAGAVVNFAAESHVDRSILDPEAFLRTGVIGVHVLLEACRREAERALERAEVGATERAAERAEVGAMERAAVGERLGSGPETRRGPRFLQVSTDEVYGSVEDGHSREDHALRPRSPYAAAKAAGELLVQSYFVTYGLDVVVTRGSNTYGPYQHPEKLIPLFITNALDDLPLPLYGDGKQRRDWLHVSDHAGAIEHVLRYGRSGEVYNVPGDAELANRNVVASLLERLGKPWSLVRSVEDRPGHDRRYAMDGAKLRELGWRNGTSFEQGLADTIDWFIANEPWWRAIRSGEWDAYYERQYGPRIASGVAAAAIVPGDSSAR